MDHWPIDRIMTPSGSYYYSPPGYDVDPYLRNTGGGLRKIALDLAVDLAKSKPDADIIALAQQFYEFLNAENLSAEKHSEELRLKAQLSAMPAHHKASHAS